MNPTMLETIEVETGPKPTGSIIWLHGLGADGHDFEPVVPEIVRPGSRALRFIFPHAPVRPVTLNGGMPMRAWYDVRGLDRHSAQDELGIRAADAAVCALIRRENERGIAPNRIVLAGFSQGGAMALYTGARFGERLAGVMALSCYMVLAATFAAEHQAANQQTPIFMAHGRQDPVLDIGMGKAACSLLVAAGYAVEWHDYPMAHSVCAEELTAIASFLQKVLP